jgi:hypothetical protein
MSFHQPPDLQRPDRLAGPRANVWVLATSRRGEPIGWEQRGFRTLKRLFVINNREGMPKMKTAVIAATLALGLGLSGAYAQNANDRPGMAAPQEGTMSQPNQPGSMSNPQRAPQTTGANPGNTKSMDEQAGGNNQAVERNPNGAPIGSKTNPSPR